jgi:hypothetical protein
MLKRTTLAALGRAAQGGEDHLARRALAGADPLVALFCRPRVTKAIARASSLVADRSDRGHVLRLAYLLEAGCREEADYEDRAAVRRDFEALAVGAPPVRQGWHLSIAALALVVVAVAFAVVRPWSAKSFDPRSAPLGKALGDDLARYVASVSRASHARAGDDEPGRAPDPPRLDDASRERVLSAVARDVGGAGSEAARRLFVAYEAAAQSPAGDRGLDDAMVGALQRTNGLVREAHRPYWFDVIGDSATGPLIVAYYVARSATVSAEGASILVLRVQRLDTLNRSLALLGYTSPRMGAAVVTLDTLEEEAISLLLPALEPGTVAHVVDRETEASAPDWAEAIEKRAGEELRAEVPADRRAVLADVADLLARRTAVLATLQVVAQYAGGSIITPTRLVETDRLDGLDGRVARSVLAEWRDVNAGLAEPRAQAAVGAFVEGLATIVDRHEVQHQIDFRAGIVPVPAVMDDTLGIEGASGLDPSPLEARCRDELSAELAAMAQTPELASTAFMIATIPLFDRHDWGSPYSYVAAAILTALGRELGGTEATYAGRGAFLRESAASAFLAITAKSGPEIAILAGRAYARLFGHELARVRAGAWQDSPRWSR